MALLTRWLRRSTVSTPAAAAPPPAADGRRSDWVDDVASLLGREPVNLDTPEMQRFLAGKRILVTGAGGSIGGEICRQVMRFCPARLILLDRSEAGLFEIDRELRHRWLGSDLRACVADVTDAVRLGRVFEEERPEIVVHAAAHKHVPMMEANPGEAVKNNVFGTRTAARCAAEGRAEAFVLISTDKAVKPTSVMGATKRCAEYVVQAEAATSPGTRFMAVRFGNVLGSSGSVVPIFAKQIAAGGPVTVTHPDMRRFFMTIPEASQLVLQAGSMGAGGEIFVLDMGEPVRIVELAEAMIRRAGLTLGEDIALRFTGIRPGEKLEEELAGEDEPTLPTGHEKIHVWQLPAAAPQQVQAMLDRLGRVIDAEAPTVLAALRQAVPEYQPEQPAPLRLAA